MLKTMELLELPLEIYPTLFRMAIALALGLLIGLERGWSKIMAISAPAPASC